MGLGHMRRNLLLAQALQHSRLQAVVLMIAGAREASQVTQAAGVDCVALPSLWKDGAGQYSPRHLDVPLADLLSVRARTAAAALEAFAPDVLIVDNVPRGALHELDPALEALRARGRTRLVLGLRDVLDDPVTLQGEWTRAQNHEAVRRYYDAVWIYGDPAVYDPVREYGFTPDVATKVRYTGYLDQRARTRYAGRQRGDPLTLLGLPPGPLALCLVGSGQDGGQLAEAFAQAELPGNTNGVLVMGPCMPLDVRHRVARAAAGRPGWRMIPFLSEPTRLVRRADHVVAMGGYNTVCEVLSFRKPALIVPRVAPRREQLIRAERLEALGLVDVLHPAELTPRALSDWLALSRTPPPPARQRVDLDGLTRVPRFLKELLATTPDAA
jgi:predicted glycosyltransferase